MSRVQVPADVTLPELAVRRFVERLREKPKRFTKRAVDAQLRSWGRTALTHLRGIEPWDPQHSGYVSYAIRYLEDAFPLRGESPVYDEAVVTRGRDLLRYSVKPLGDEDGVGYNGWPLRSMFPRYVCMFVSSAIDLVADWRKEDFLERAMGGLKHGGMLITHPTWPGLSIPARSRRISKVKNVGDVRKMKDIHIQEPVHLRPLSTIWIGDDFTLIARSAQILLDRRPFAARYSTRPTWWRLRADPFGKRAVKNFIPKLTSFLRFNSGYAIRIYRADRWIGMDRNLVVMLANDDLSARSNDIWGFVVDSHDRDSAYGARGYLENKVFAAHGWPASAPSSTTGAAAVAMSHRVYLSM